MTQSETVTLLFSDIVNSAEHLERAGDEAGERLFHIQHRLMSDAIEASGGRELQWMGDGVLASFGSTADAVTCAMRMQQASHSAPEGANFALRVGLHVGEVIRREDGYFGTTIVIARRLCDKADTGQILCSRTVAELLSARSSFEFRDIGNHMLKGIAAPVGVCELIYELTNPAAMLNRTPFVGREQQIKWLGTKLDDLMNGRGAVTMLRGEAGIGKTRLLEEFSQIAATSGVTVLRGACYDGEWQRPYGPFAEAITEYARNSDRSELAAIIGKRAGVLARMAPVLNDLIDDVATPDAIGGEDEQFRLYDAVAQFFIGITAHAPLVLILDDLHWADRGVTSMLNHVAHFTPKYPILVIGAYRDAEVNRQHPLTAALAAISRLRGFEAVTLKGLKGEDVAALLERIAHQDAPQALTSALGHATEGNPLFLREVLLNLFEEGKILVEGKSWASSLNVDELRIPEGVRQVINQRLSRLSESAKELLSVASAFNGSFSFEVATATAGLDEDTALTAIDEALEAQLLRAGATHDTFDFTHSLLRHTLYANLNPVRRARLHRRIAEEMERAWGERAGQHAAEVAFHFWRAAAAKGTDKGAQYALAAADNAAASYAHDDVATFLRIALDLLPPVDPRRSQTLARLSQALTWALDAEAALTTANEAGALILKTAGPDAAADYYEQTARAMYTAGLTRPAWQLAKVGLRYIGARRDITWASLTDIDINRAEGEDPNGPGVALDSPESRALAEVLRALPQEEVASRNIELIHLSREQLLADPAPGPRLVMMTGDYRVAEATWRQQASESERRGAIAHAVRAWAGVARCQNMIGNFPEAQAAFDHATAMAARIARPTFGRLALHAARVEMHLAMNEDIKQLVEDIRKAFGGGDEEILDMIQGMGPEGKWGMSLGFAYSARSFAAAGQSEIALNFLSMLPNAIERGAPWALNYVGTICMAATTIWSLKRTDYIEIIERNLREKVLKPDFHFPMSDSRLCLARLCALQGRYDEASQWFDKSRDFLDTHGSRTLRSIADYDEALMYLRRGEAGDPMRALSFLHKAHDQFEQLGMSGWIRATERLASRHSLNLNNL
ncbi:MAG TPA: AAA family ATPase [Candidatus Binataceae bacterium]|nr:AAA family ATPase [Candidatus Binataceae bacterium]